MPQLTEHVTTISKFYVPLILLDVLTSQKHFLFKHFVKTTDEIQYL